MSEIIEFIIEFIMEIVVEGSSEIIENKKISKWVRYPLIAIVVLVGLGIIGFFIYLSLTIMEDSLIGGLIILGISLLLLGCMIYKCIKMYKNIKKPYSNK